ncbi:Rne/Rng family ribonuclease [Marinicella meishanensis]|uniref:Rne/Rng family ribonuclease n=1 Tax=Marinicella meishanensis TaxID=2873263 RepID=UPI001CBC3919|nr:Rne/Rng family ribonuclease [Marinicella sp. NBU2979]
MAKEILINSNNFETRVALVEDGLLSEICLERSQQHSIVGNIYQGTVEKVLPGLQAAFVNIGENKAAFIHVSDIEEQQADNRPDGYEANYGSIAQILHEGQKIVVQVYKDQIGSKGARITTQLSIPSRYLVMMPNNPNLTAISARITDDQERERLTELLQKINHGNEAFGLIARTNAELAGHTALFHDWRFLHRLWARLDVRIKAAKSPSLIYSEFSLAKKVVRDQVNENLTRITTDSHEIFANLSEFLQDFAPEWGGELVEHTVSRPLFDQFHIDDEIDRSISRKVDLKSGGNLVFDQNEAMTTIDVNTGQFVGYKSLEDTAFKTNLEAAQAIARQLRLRNIGGIVIIDFIDMVEKSHKLQVLQTLEEQLEGDSARTNVLGFTGLGLVEMTRKRTTENLQDMLCEPCDKCHGMGSIETIQTISFKLFREITRSVKQFKASKVMVIGSARLVQYIIDEHSETLAEMEETLGKRISFQAEESYERHQHDVVLL